MNRRDFIARKARVMGQALDDLVATYAADGAGSIPICPICRRRRRCCGSSRCWRRSSSPATGRGCPAASQVEALLLERLDEAYNLAQRQVRRALPLRWQCEYRARLRPGQLAARRRGRGRGCGDRGAVLGQELARIRSPQAGRGGRLHRREPAALGLRGDRPGRLSPGSGPSPRTGSPTSLLSPAGCRSCRG